MKSVLFFLNHIEFYFDNKCPVFFSVSAGFVCGWGESEPVNFASFSILMNVPHTVNIATYI